MRNKVLAAKRSRKWYSLNKEQHKQAAQNWRDKNPIKWKEICRSCNWKKMGLSITIEQYRELYKIQEYKCAICGISAKYPDLHLDHCHKTNKVRGLLCFKCNNALGSFQDSISSLLKAIKYLKGQSNGKLTPMV